MDGFQLVTRKNKKKWNKSKTKKPKMNPINYRKHEGNAVIDIERCFRKLQDTKTSIGSSDFWKDFKDNNLQLASPSLDAKEIVLYGIGSIGSSVIAANQFAMVVLIAEHLQLQVMFYDPVLTEEEKKIMAKFGMVPIEKNEECKRRVRVSTLFMMFHCGKAMYNNLLWANWDQLSQIMIIGNTFTSYSDRIPYKKLLQTAPFIAKIIPYTKEVIINITQEYEVIFNDTSVHLFPDTLLQAADSSMWVDVVEPIASLDDVEIIKRKEDGE